MDQICLKYCQLFLLIMRIHLISKLIVLSANIDSFLTICQLIKQIITNNSNQQIQHNKSFFESLPNITPKTDNFILIYLFNNTSYKIKSEHHRFNSTHHQLNQQHTKTKIKNITVKQTAHSPMKQPQLLPPTHNHIKAHLQIEQLRNIIRHSLNQKSQAFRNPSSYTYHNPHHLYYHIETRSSFAQYFVLIFFKKKTKLLKSIVFEEESTTQSMEKINHALYFRSEKSLLYDYFGGGMSPLPPINKRTQYYCKIKYKKTRKEEKSSAVWFWL